MLTCRVVFFTLLTLPFFSLVGNARSLENHAPIPKPIAPVQVTFFGNNSNLPSGVEAVRQHGDVTLTIYNLDDHQNLEKALSKGLPKGQQNVTKAMEIARLRLREISPDRFRSVFEGQLKAKEWKIKRFPAVVFGNGDSVIYGVTDLDACRTIWLSSQIVGGNRAK